MEVILGAVLESGHDEELERILLALTQLGLLLSWHRLADASYRVCVDDQIAQNLMALRSLAAGN